MRKDRSKLKIKTSWDLSLLLKSDNDPNINKILKKCEDKSYEFINKWNGREDYLSDAKVLKEALDELEALEVKYRATGKVGYYFVLRDSQDSDNSHIKKMLAKINDAEVKIANDMAFFDIKLSKIDENTQKRFLNSSELKPYKHFLETTFRDSKHILSEKEEKILNLLGKPAFGDWVKMVSNSLSNAQLQIVNTSGKNETKTMEEALSLASYDKSKKVRDSASKALHKLFSDNLNIAERELNAILYTKKVIDELRGYKTPNSARLLSDDIEPEVVNAMAEAVTEKFNLSQDYYKFKAKVLGVNKFSYFERNLSYGEVSKEFTYEDSVNLVFNVFNDIDTEFGDYLKNYVETGRFDVFPKKGKRGGAFCINFSKAEPVYIMLNHTNKLTDVKTIAHEMGHAINDELMNKAQNGINASTTLATAEVASTFFESFLQDKLAEEVGDEERLVLLIQDIDNEISTIIRQTACYNFETHLHNEFREKGFLSKDEIGEIFKKHMSAYMGPAIDQKALGHLGWVYWSHIRRFFYVYSYSNGLLIAKAMKRKYKEDKSFIKEVKKFLSAGASKSPMEIFLDMGIDISKKEFWFEGLSDLENKINQAKSLAKKLGKI